MIYVSPSKNPCLNLQFWKKSRRFVDWCHWADLRGALWIFPCIVFCLAGIWKIEAQSQSMYRSRVVHATTLLIIKGLSLRSLHLFSTLTLFLPTCWYNMWSIESNKNTILTPFWRTIWPTTPSICYIHFWPWVYGFFWHPPKIQIAPLQTLSFAPF